MLMLNVEQDIKRIDPFKSDPAFLIKKYQEHNEQIDAKMKQIINQDMKLPQDHKLLSEMKVLLNRMSSIKAQLDLRISTVTKLK